CPESTPGSLVYLPLACGTRDDHVTTPLRRRFVPRQARAEPWKQASTRVVRDRGTVETRHVRKTETAQHRRADVHGADVRAIRPLGPGAAAEGDDRHVELA